MMENAVQGDDPDSAAKIGIGRDAAPVLITTFSNEQHGYGNDAR
jgi:hypothetical protein